jgi:hypothetical protein
MISGDGNSAFYALVVHLSLYSDHINFIFWFMKKTPHEKKGWKTCPKPDVFICSIADSITSCGSDKTTTRS